MSARFLQRQGREQEGEAFSRYGFPKGQCSLGRARPQELWKAGGGLGTISQASLQLPACLAWQRWRAQ